MTQKEVVVLAPQYVRKFKCIGGACEETCCAKWTIGIDKKTYQKYKRIPDPVLKKKIEKGISKNRSNPTEEYFGKMNLIDEKCSFLTKEGWCEIQSTLGEGYLCNTCLDYPRNKYKVNNVLEVGLNLSCPEAARLALLNKEPMEFDQFLEVVEREGQVNLLHMQQDRKDSWKQYFWEIRIFVIGLLQNRVYSLQERLIVVGLFFKKVEELIYSNQEQKIEGLIEEYNKNVNNKGYKNIFDELPKNMEVQIALLKAIISKESKMGNQNKTKYANYVQQIIKGLEWENETFNESKYQSTALSIYNPFMEEHEYILENYLVNYIFKEKMPLDKNTPFESYMNLILHYAIIKMHLIGVGAYDQTLSIDKTVNIIQSFSREFEHNQLFFNTLIDDLKRQGMTQMGYMYAFINH